MSEKENIDVNSVVNKRGRAKQAFFISMLVIELVAIFFLLEYLIKTLKLTSPGLMIFCVGGIFLSVEAVVGKRQFISKALGLVLSLPFVIYYSYLWPFALKAKGVPTDFETIYTSMTYQEFFSEHQFEVLIFAVFSLAVVVWFLRRK